jgi:hypothetical protein
MMETRLNASVLVAGSSSDAFQCGSTGVMAGGGWESVEIRCFLIKIVFLGGFRRVLCSFGAGCG